MYARPRVLATLLAVGCHGMISGGDTGEGGSAGGGATGGSGAGGSGGTTVDNKTGVFLSEIMYHAVLDDGVTEDHEFIELHNRGDKAVLLAGWTIGGDVRFAFPASTSIQSGQYLVVAKNRAELLKVAGYRLAPENVLGDYMGQLNNGGGQILLNGAAGNVDAVVFDDAFPWTSGADALGAQEDFLAADLLPLDKHRFMGRSLERVSFDVPAGEPANWVASMVDGATPGRANGGAGEIRPIVVELSVTPRGGTGKIIRATNPAVVQVKFSDRGVVRDPEVEYFVDDLAVTNEAIKPVKLTGGLAELPMQADRAIVRYRIMGDRGRGRELISPHASDPFAWHAYFVTPAPASSAPVYEVLIAMPSWNRMWDAIAPGRLIGMCQPNLRWNENVPGVYVYDGVVYDVRVRYGGSPYNRRLGRTIARWPAGAAPTGPAPMLALSWRFKFPRYNKLLGQRTGSYLNKLSQSCPGIGWTVEGKLMNQAGVPAIDVRFGRQYVNGNYYNYVMEKEDLDAELIKKRWKGVTGDLYKPDGATLPVDQGPWGPADGRLITDFCGFPARQRWEYTYDIKTDGKGLDDIIAMLTALQAARAGGVPAMKKFFTDSFDYQEILSYLAVRNWSAPWDDAFHNYFLFRRSDGKWTMLPDDFDGEIGKQRRYAGNVSFFIGELGDPQNNSTGLPGEWWSYYKDTFFKAYREEFKQKLRDLDKTILNPAAVLPAIDEAARTLSVPDMMASPAGMACNPVTEIDGMKRFVNERHTAILGL